MSQIEDGRRIHAKGTEQRKTGLKAGLYGAVGKITRDLNNTNRMGGMLP